MKSSEILKHLSQCTPDLLVMTSYRAASCLTSQHMQAGRSTMSLLSCSAKKTIWLCTGDSLYLFLLVSAWS